jgi:hypothetical protein
MLSTFIRAYRMTVLSAEEHIVKIPLESVLRTQDSAILLTGFNIRSKLFLEIFKDLYISIGFH